MTQREKILKAKGYTYDCGAPDHYSAVLKAQNFRRRGYFATIDRAAKWNYLLLYLL